MKKKVTPPPTTRSTQKARHRSKILSLIRTAELISRTDIAKATGLSQASVTGITADLIGEGLIEERKSGAYEGGRRPTLMAIRADGAHVIGINMTIRQIRIVIINFQAELKASHIIPLEKDYYSPEEIIDCISQGIGTCMWDSNFSRDQIAGVGIGIPGPVDSQSGVVHFLPNYGWEEIPFRDMLSEKINHPVFIDNSSNNLAIAEQWYGNGKGRDNFIVITIENGVGAGTVLNGQLYRGSTGIASEFGHTCVDPHGPKCRCGRRGCIEAYGGNKAILQTASFIAQEGKWTSEITDPENITFEDVLQDLENEDSQMKQIYQVVGEKLGMGIYNLTTLLNPQLIIITGKGVAAGDHLFSPMLATIESMSFGKIVTAKTEILIQEWKESDWARGAGTLVLKEIYNLNSL